MPHAVMLFAAGFGSRMGALTRDIPKPMLPLAGRVMIDFALDLARDIDADPIVANLHYLPDPLRAHLAPQGVFLSHETPDVLETGGGLRAALPLLGTGPVFTVNTDVIWQGPNPLALLRDAWDPDRMDALVMCVPCAHALGHDGGGDFALDGKARILRRGDLIYGGVQILRTDRLADIEDHAFSLNLLWDRFIADGTLFGLRYPGRWCDAGHPDGLVLAETMLADPNV